MLGSNYGSMDDVFNYSQEHNVPHHIAAVAVKSQHINKPTLWPEIKPYDGPSDSAKVDLVTSDRGDIITEMAKMISDYMQFPPSTIFLHGLGCVSAAMAKSFCLDYGGKDGMYCNLYVVTAQPPSTGKSAVNDILFGPAFESYQKFNERNAKERTKLDIEIRRLQKDLDTSDKKGQNDYDIMEILDNIEQKKRRARDVAYIKPTITNATIEALERETGNQGGMFNIVSDEADSINVVFGAVYSDEKSSNKSNSELILKAWDNGYVSSTRIGRDGLDSRARGAISVLAQADSVDTILSAGASGRGLAERFFLLNEPSWLGHRDRQNRGKFDKQLHSIYEAMIDNVINQDPIKMTFTPAANKQFENYESFIEKKMAEDGEYSHNLFTGFMGKAAKQCRKIAAVLHVAEHWQDGGKRSLTIDEDYALWAVGIFDELGKTFRAASDKLGHVGEASEFEKLASVFIKSAEKGRLKLTLSSLRDQVKNVKPFKGSRNLTRRLKENAIPELEKHNYCILDGQTIFINPRLK